MINFTYSKAASAAGAVEAVSKDSSAMFIAGGTNLIDLMKHGMTAPGTIVDIGKLPLQEIIKSEHALQLGALVSNSEVAEHALVKQYFPLLSMAIHAGASPQLRNMATTGGNLMQRTRCSYFYDLSMACNKRAPGSGCGALKGYNRMHAIFGASESCIAVHPSDMCVALAALDATVIVKGKVADRSIPFTDFHRLPGTAPEKDNTLERGELITGVVLPFNNFNKAHYLKIRDRSAYAFALVSVAVTLEITGGIINKAAIAMGGVAHKPWRLTETEHFLKGKKATAANFKTAATLAMKGARSFGHNDFKLKMAPAAVITALINAANS